MRADQRHRSDQQQRRNRLRNSIENEIIAIAADIAQPQRLIADNEALAFVECAPAELEALLLTHPKIADAAVIPSPDEDAGEVPKAFIIKKDPSLTEQEVIAFSAEKLAHFKRIKRVEFVTSIPKTTSGKIIRRELKEKEKKLVESLKKPKL